jgi:hypothetical protein
MALKQKSMIARTAVDKKTALVARLALMIAAKENPAMYERFSQQRQRYLQMKLMLIKKYTPKAIMAARQLMSKQ